jgi:phenylalanyl-tRNA synthetase alpha subunit
MMFFLSVFLSSSESIGWRYNWSHEEAATTLLRTHTTAVSARMLHKLAASLEADGVNGCVLF